MCSYIRKISILIFPIVYFFIKSTPIIYSHTMTGDSLPSADTARGISTYGVLKVARVVGDKFFVKNLCKFFTKSIIVEVNLLGV